MDNIDEKIDFSDKTLQELAEILCCALEDLSTAVDQDLVLALIDAGADMTYEKDGETALHYVLKRDNLEHIALVMIDKGAELATKNKDGLTGLSHAVLTHNKGDFLAAVLARSPQELLEEKDKSGSTPLHLAALNRNGSLRKIELLLDRGANIDAQDDEGHTPLMYAIFAGWEDNADLLVQRGACLDVRSNKGNKALAVAHDFKDVKENRIVEILERETARRHTEQRIREARDALVVPEGAVVQAPRLNIPKRG